MRIVVVAVPHVEIAEDDDTRFRTDAFKQDVLSNTENACTIF